jgi:hypothetical protein
VAKYQAIGALQFNIPQLTIDVQMGHTASSLLVFVAGQLSVTGNQPLNYAQSFQLVSEYEALYFKNKPLSTYI